MIDWKRKLSSRKFWAAVVGFVTAMLAAFGVSDLTAGQVTAMVSALGVLVSYIIGESVVDKGSVENTVVVKEAVSRANSLGEIDSPLSTAAKETEYE